MLYESTKILLQSILNSLETLDGTGWDEQNESGKQCLYEMHQMSKPLYKGYRTEGSKGKTPALVPVSENINRAIPYVKAMVSAIRRQDRATAMQSGRAAVAEMNGTAVPRPVSHAIAPKIEVKEAPKVLRQHKKPVSQRRPAVKERRPAKRARAFTAGSH
jgi:hypothetical protein